MSNIRPQVQISIRLYSSDLYVVEFFKKRIYVFCAETAHNGVRARVSVA